MDKEIVSLVSDSHTYRAIVGKYIKRQIDSLGFTQKEIAEVAGVDPSNLSRIILGKYAVSVDILERVCRVIGLQIAFVEPFKHEDLHLAISMALFQKRNLEKYCHKLVSDGISIN